MEYSSGGYAVRPLDGFQLDVTEGSLVILLGPSGCGKTTLLSCLGGILKPTSGTIRFGDVDVTALDARAVSEYRRHTVGIVFQAFNLVASSDRARKRHGAVTRRRRRAESRRERGPRNCSRGSGWSHA